MGDEEQVFDFGSKKKKKSKEPCSSMRLDAETQIHSSGSQGAQANVPSPKVRPD